MAEKTIEENEQIEINSTYYHYVRHGDVDAFEALGWVIAAKLQGHHGNYSVLMKWPNETKPITPKNALD